MKPALEEEEEVLARDLWPLTTTTFPHGEFEGGQSQPASKWAVGEGNHRIGWDHGLGFYDGGNLIQGAAPRRKPESSQSVHKTPELITCPLGTYEEITKHGVYY